jgi:hypothetical protein
MLLTYLVYRNLKETERTNDILQDIDDEAITAFFIIIFLTAAFWPFGFLASPDLSGEVADLCRSLVLFPVDLAC